MKANACDTRRDEIAAACREQVVFCRNRGADFTAAIVDAAADEIENGDAAFALMGDFKGDPLREALPLRIAGAFHALVLAGRAGDLAPFYARSDQIPAIPALRRAIAPLWVKEAALFKCYMSKPPQTNEIRRAAALLPGFSKIAEISGGPIDILELGASSGLLLGWDRFRYDFTVAQWGDSDAVIESEWRGERPPKLYAPIAIRRRAGCDLHPFDLSDPEQLLHAQSYIWPEDAVRRVLFDTAVEKNGALSKHVEQADALAWLERELEKRAEDAATVVYHSVFAPYLSDARRMKMRRLIEAAGQSATMDAPLAWLRFEPESVGDSMEFFTDLQVWPHGSNMRLARAHPHGAWVEPLDDF